MNCTFIYRLLVIVLINSGVHHCFGQEKTLSADEILKLYQESSLKENILSLDSSDLEINRFVKDTFDFMYQGDFDGNGMDDLLTAITPNYGCGYQFFLFDYEINKKAKQVVKLNPACPYYCYLVPAEKANEFTYYYLNKKQDSIFTQDILMYKGELIDKDYVERKPLKVKAFKINLKTRYQDVEYRYNGKQLVRYLIDDGKKELLPIQKDTADLIIELISRIDFATLKKRNTHFDDAPSLHIEIVSKRQNTINFMDKINFFTGGSLYYSVSLTTLYKLLYPEYFKEEYW